MQDLQVGIVGLGTQGSLYAGLLCGQLGPMTLPCPKGICLAAASSRSAEAKSRLPKDCDAVFFTDWQEMLRSDCIDAVIITVPHDLHPAIAMEALRQGKHVLCEKPAAVRASDVRAMLQTKNACASDVRKMLSAKDAGAEDIRAELGAKDAHSPVLAMMFNNRANPLFARCHELAQSGELGELRHVNWIVNSCWRPDAYYASGSWRGSWSGEGGGLLVNQIAHQLDLLLWICGEPSTVRSVLHEGRYRNIEVENEVAASFVFPNGATGELCSNGYDPFGVDRLEISFSKGKILLEDAKRLTVTRYKEDEKNWNDSMDFRMFSNLLRSDPGQLAETEVTEEQLPFFAPYNRIFENFAAHVAGREDLLAPAEAGLLEVQLANCIYLSGWTGKEIEFPGDDEAYDCLLQEKQHSANDR